MKRSFSVKNIYQRIENGIIAWDLKKLTTYMIGAAIIVGVAGSYIWYSRMYMTNERRFWVAIENSMATPSVTRTLTSGGSGNQVVQEQQFHFSPQKVSRSYVSFVQKSATVDTAVETEGVSFLDSQYSRYTSFRSNQTKDDGSPISLDAILGKWEGTTVTEENLETARTNYLGEMVSLAIFGNYDARFRHDTIQAFRDNDTYKINTGAITEDKIDGNTVILVPVSVGLKSFATELQKGFIKSGYGNFEALNPDNFTENSRIAAQFTIDKRTKTITAISFGSREESYTGYGINRQISAPQAEYESGELEAIVQEEISSIL